MPTLHKLPAGTTQDETDNIRDTRALLEEVITELKVMNIHLAVLSGETNSQNDIQEDR